MKNNALEIRINGKKFEFTDTHITGEQLLQLVQLHPANDYEVLLKINNKELEPIQLDESVDLTNPEIETFIIKPYQTISIEVDDETYPVNELFMTPEEIMTVAGLDPKGYYLKQIIGHQDITYKNDPKHRIGIVNGLKFSSCKIASTTVS